MKKVPVSTNQEGEGMSGRKRWLQGVRKILLKGMDLITAFIALRVYLEKQTVYSIVYSCKAMVESWLTKH
jgi:hypothetical protein